MTAMSPEPLTRNSRIARWLQAISLFVLVSVIALRPLISETYDSAGNSISRAVDVLADPSPARTLGFDLAILVATCLWLLAFALSRAARYRWTGLEIGLPLLVVAGIISCYYAGNKRLAINGTVDWLCLPILTITLVQLLHAQWQRRLVLAAILASASVNAAQCFEQYFVGFAETIEQYEAGKEEFWARQSVELDSTTVDAFERRLRAREASGFFAHSNVAGAYLMLCAFAAIGVIASQLHMVQVWANPLEALSFIVALVLTFVMIGAVFLTGSTGAAVAGAFAIALLIVAWWKREWIAIHRRRVFWISWIIIIAGIAAVIGHGLYHDSLPGWSLTFRWQYWKASASMIADHFWTGVGRENFGRHYTFYKDIASPEEVSNPHNFFVQAAAEWGILGLIAVAAMLVGVMQRVVRLSFRPPLQNLSGERPKWANNVLWGVCLGSVIVFGVASLLGSIDPYYVYYSATFAGIIWLPTFLAFSHTVAIRNESSPILTLAMATGLFAFLLQDTINFALFIPASATTFFALLAAWLSYGDVQKGGAASPRSRLRWIANVIACGLTLATLIFVLLPVHRCAGWLEVARAGFSASYAREDDPKLKAYRAASAADPLDPTPWSDQARLLTVADEASLRLALDSLAQAILRDANYAAFRRQQSQLYLFAAAHSHQPVDYLHAVESAKSALSLYPADPAGLVSMADIETAAGKDLQSKELLLAAIGHYQEALSLDEKRLEWETIQRFRPRVVDEIHTKIRSAEKILQEQE